MLGIDIIVSRKAEYQKCNVKTNVHSRNLGLSRVFSSLFLFSVQATKRTGPAVGEPLHYTTQTLDSVHPEGRVEVKSVS